MHVLPRKKRVESQVLTRLCLVRPFSLDRKYIFAGLIPFLYKKLCQLEQFWNYHSKPARGIYCAKYYGQGGWEKNGAGEKNEALRDKMKKKEKEEKEKGESGFFFC